MQKDIHSIFESCLAIDGRFLNLEDAKKNREKYFTTSECMIVSVSTTEEYYEILTEELSESSCGINNFFSGEIDSNELLGYDILGWDISGFTSIQSTNLRLKRKKFFRLESMMG